MTVSPWLAIIGVGEEGLEGLIPAARALLRQAELVVGGARHLQLIGPVAGRTLAWPSPLTDAIPAILAERGRPVVVLASGDPFFYGIGTTLIAHVPRAEMIVLPGISAFSLAAARLGWALQDTALMSLHGRAVERILPHLQPGSRILALSWDETTPMRLAGMLVERGLGASVLHVLEAMGGPRERIRTVAASDFNLSDINPLNVVAIDVVAGSDARVLPLTPGLPDDLFEHQGQITKRDIRAMTLAALAPRRGECLWDIGAGSGSIGIEWMLADPANRAVAIEPRADRLAMIARNALALGVPGLAIVEGTAPLALAGLPSPDAVFIGGGATVPGVIETVVTALPVGGRLVANAVTLETEALFTGWMKQIGGTMVRLSVSQAEPIGDFLGWQPARPIVQWRLEKRA